MLRRTLIAAAPALLAARAFARTEAPPPLAAYERETGGRVGVFARNLKSGAAITWRADERFVMCSTFKASLAALVLSRVERGQEHLEAMQPFGEKDVLSYAPVAKQHA